MHVPQSGGCYELTMAVVQLVRVVDMTSRPFRILNLMKTHKKQLPRRFRFRTCAFALGPVPPCVCSSPECLTTAILPSRLEYCFCRFVVLSSSMPAPQSSHASPIGFSARRCLSWLLIHPLNTIIPLITLRLTHMIAQKPPLLYSGCTVKRINIHTDSSPTQPLQRIIHSSRSP